MEECKTRTPYREHVSPVLRKASFVQSLLVLTYEALNGLGSKDLKGRFVPHESVCGPWGGKGTPGISSLGPNGCSILRCSCLRRKRDHAMLQSVVGYQRLLLTMYSHQPVLQGRLGLCSFLLACDHPLPASSLWHPPR